MGRQREKNETPERKNETPERRNETAERKMRHQREIMGLT